MDSILELVKNLSIGDVINSIGGIFEQPSFLDSLTEIIGKISYAFDSLGSITDLSGLLDVITKIFG